MKSKTTKDGWDRHTFPNGKPFTEFRLKNGRRQGDYRVWYENGVLAEQGRYRDGLLHGIIRKWNRRGQLLGTCRFDNGTGMLCDWHDNGQLSSEISYVRGNMTGRMRWWAEDGMFYGQRYYFEDRQISKKAYVQKCASMPELPRFEDEKTRNTLGNYVRRLRREKREQARLGPTPHDLEQQ